MIDKTPNPPGLSESTTATYESTDPAYLAWVKAKLDKGMTDLKDPGKRSSEADVWKDLGLTD